EWNLQKELAAAELIQLEPQIGMANERLAMTKSEVNPQTRQIANARAVGEFLNEKYPTEQLYGWMLTQLTTVHTQAYQLAFALARQAQAAYQYELGSRTPSSSSVTGTPNSNGSRPGIACSSICA
ncbi:hypothetical protein ABFV57_29955, partial [Pseudomonas neuropathica]|uniref:Tc toxin subunit A-related protein n=1 Tax=Pseudomonas neuropathica TaxID=2730425 RepID=UPI0034D3C822